MLFSGLPPPKPVADILIVIDASQYMGYIDNNGNVVWKPEVVEFVNRFIHTTPMGPDLNRIGVVVVSSGIDDMIAITPDKALLKQSIGNLRPIFKGGCTEKGIRTASSLFYQYGRQYAVKRIVLLTDTQSNCQYRDMAEILYAQKCGIDIIHVGFGPSKGVTGPPPTDGNIPSWHVTGTEFIGGIVQPVAERAFIGMYYVVYLITPLVILFYM